MNQVLAGIATGTVLAAVFIGAITWMARRFPIRPRSYPCEHHASRRRP